jgi:hypothetical protein
MNISARRRWNWPLWTGFLVAVLAFLSYPAFFVQFPLTRNFPWVNFILFACALALLFLGLGRAFRSPASYRGKIFGPILAVLSVSILALFLYGFFVSGRELPASAAAPPVGSKAPDFTLTDTAGQTVSLAQLLTTPVHGAAPRGVLLVFYRGYW